MRTKSFLKICLQLVKFSRMTLFAFITTCEISAEIIACKFFTPVNSLWLFTLWYDIHVFTHYILRSQQRTPSTPRSRLASSQASPPHAFASQQHSAEIYSSVQINRLLATFHQSCEIHNAHCFAQLNFGNCAMAEWAQMRNTFHEFCVYNVKIYFDSSWQHAYVIGTSNGHPNPSTLQYF